MDPVDVVEVARAHSERGELVLRRRREPDGGTALELRAGGVFVMDTVEVGTERALARAALTRMRSPETVLVGGLGLGFTLAEVLADPRVRRCVVVEVEPALAAWMDDGTIPHGPALLGDPRVELVVADVATVVEAAAPASYDLVLLDVDNGPGYLVHPDNAGLYREPFLGSVRRALRPGGEVVVWSAAAAPDLLAALAATFDAADEEPIGVRLQGRDERYWLYRGAIGWAG